MFELEREISRRVGSTTEMSYKAVDWKSIRDQLGEEEAAVEILMFYHLTTPPDGSMHPWYYAFLVTRETVDQPVLIRLSDGIELAENTLDSGKAKQKLDEFVEFSNS